MSAPTAALPVPTPKRSKRRWFFVGGFVFFALATPFVYLTVARYRQEQELERIYREMDAEDPHWRWADVIATLPPASDEQNAFVQIRKVNRLFKSAPFAVAPVWYTDPKYKALEVHNARLSEENVGILRAAFNAIDPAALTESRKLMDFPKGRLKIDPTVNPNELLLDDLQYARNIVHLLECDILVRTHENDVAGAVESWHALLNTSHAIEDHPTVIGQLVRIAGQAIAIDALQRLLGQAELSEADLVKVQTLLQREADDNLLYHAMRGERAGSHQMYLDLRAGKTSASNILNSIRPRSKHPLEPALDLFPGIILKGYPEHLRMQNEQVKKSRLPDEERWKAMQEFDQKSRESRDNLFMMMMMPGTAKLWEACQRDQANLRCAIVAVAAERYRTQNGAWPGGLDDLTKCRLLDAISKDPFDGKPIRMQRTPTGVVVYTVGYDKIDNQGKLSSNPRVPGTDLGFELWDRQLRGIAPAVEQEK